MGLAAKKLDIINWITNLNDEEILEKINSLRKREADWWDTIDDDEKAEILEGLSQLDRGESVAHEQVMAKYKKWL
jgi:predicted transcriptional regulator